MKLDNADNVGPAIWTKIIDVKCCVFRVSEYIGFFFLLNTVCREGSAYSEWVSYSKYPGFVINTGNMAFFHLKDDVMFILHQRYANITTRRGHDVL